LFSVKGVRDEWIIKKNCGSRENEFFRVEDGRCIWDVMADYDRRLLSQWPATVDLIVRSGSRDAGLLPILFRSIELFWPKGIGKIIVVLDKNEEYLVRTLLPDYVSIFFEEFPPGVPGRLGNQLSNFWADNYTSADYIAVVDSDVVFNTKITPDQLFYKDSEKLILIANKHWQQELWQPGNDWWLGEEMYHGNFMVGLPVIYPRWVLPLFRKFVMERHGDLKYFDNVMIEWSKKENWGYFSQFCILGNFMYQFHREKFHFTFEGYDEPAMRISQHVFISRWYEGPPSPPKVTEKYVNASAKIIHEALCFAVPPGELNNCKQFEGKEHDILWNYLPWHHWGESMTKFDPKAILKNHYDELYKLFPKDLPKS